MSRLYFIGLTLLIVAFTAYPEDGKAQCSAEDISSYVGAGMTAEQLSQLCPNDSGGNPSGYYLEYSSVCVTNWGVCPMSIYAQVPVGSYCECYTQTGQRILGVAQ